MNNHLRLNMARNEWLAANDAACTEAASYISKKGEFNPKIEKPWPKWEALRLVADEKWQVYYRLLRGA